MSKTKSYFGVVICAFLASLFVSGLYNNIVFAASASISTTGTVSIDVSAAGNSANLGSDTLTVNTTCSTGYTVSISSSIADTTLYKDGDNTSTSKITPSTGTVTSPASILGNNLGTWGYSTTATSVQDNFIGLTNTPTIIKQSSTASATTGDSIPVYYGVSIPTSLEPGTYTMAKDSSNNPGTIVYQLTTPTECNPYIIKYNGNNNDAGTTMSVTNTVDEGQSTTLMPSNFKRAGYGFAGWNTKADGTGVDFGPMETVTLSTTDTKGNALLQAANGKEITLYAKWIQSAGNIQSWTGCGSMTTGDVTALKDTRDNNVYAVAKLADGNCWMIENLRLGGSSAMNLTTANTGSTFTLPATTNTFTTGSGTYETIQMSAKNTLEASADMTATNAEVYSYGNYYSWPAAIGSTTAYSTNNQSVNTSICPAGWHLPKGGQNTVASGQSGDFYVLTTTLMGGEAPNNPNNGYAYYQGTVNGVDVGAKASSLLRTYPNNILYSGYLDGPSFYYRGSHGYYWSSTVSSSNGSYNLRFNSSDVRPGTYNYNKYNGFSVRCVADEPAPTTLSEMKTMQQMTSAICAATPEGTEKQLRDTRDNKTYWVAKLADGKCWMTQNLDLDLSTSKTLTPSDSDVTADWTPTRGTINASSVTNNSISGWADDVNTPYSVDPGNVYWNAFPFYTSTANNFMANDWGSSPVKFQKNTAFNSNGEHGHVGNYYNWSAAVASNNTSGYTSSTIANPANNPQSSICPKGWRLPTISDASNTTAGSTNEFGRLDRLYNPSTNTSQNLEKAPLYFVRGGFVTSSQQYESGNSGSYWSSSVYSSSYAHYLFLSSSYVHPTSYDIRSYGLSVRCVTREDPSLATISTMQEMTSDICAATTVGTEKQLRDTRDNKTYWVAKLQDDKCWMTQNLDLDLSTSKALTPSDSDVTANWTPTRGTINASSVTNNSISGWSNDYNTPYSVDPGNVYWNNSPFYSSTTNLFMNNDFGSNPVKFQRNTAFSTNGEHGHVGNYYNWSAAVAMNSTSSYTASTYNNPANNPQTSICPKGWRLPTVSNASNTTAGSTNEFGRLSQLYNSGSTSTSQNLEAAPLYFVRSGYVYSSQQNYAGYLSNYWSSSVYSSSSAYSIYFSSDSVNPTRNYNRSDGFSVRCVAR